MADFLVDSNVLLRWVQPGSPQRPIVRRALRTLVRRGDTLCITPQNQIEFWSVATRSAIRGGLALSPAEADRKLRRIEGVFTLLPDSPAILPAWRQLVAAVGVSDTHVHDARLAAVMQVYSVTHILTFNVSDFLLFPGIIVVDPASV
jgi:predicted nucleic acid-binding protein